MPRHPFATDLAPRRSRVGWNTNLVKARSSRDAWGCLVADKGNPNQNIKTILFPTRLQGFAVGTDGNKVHFNPHDRTFDPIHAIFTWDGTNATKASSSPYKVVVMGARGLSVNGVMFHEGTINLTSGCVIKMGFHAFVFRAYSLPGATPYLGATHQEYQFRRFVGKGGFGSVSVADVRETRIPVAVKVIRIEEATRRRKGIRNKVLKDAHRAITREILGLSSLRHPNLLKFERAFCQQDQVDIVMEYMEGDNLHEYVSDMGKLPMKHVRQIARQICDAGSFLHASGFIHRDLKLQNVIYNPKTERVKVIDMGLCLPQAEHQGWKERQARKTYLQYLAEALRLAKTDDRDGLSYNVGTSSYMAPEQADPNFEYNERVDSYSAGIIIYETLTGYRAHRKTSNKAEAIKARGTVWLTRLSGLVSSPTAIDFITKLGTEQAFWRMTLTQARQHPWLGEVPTEAEEAEAIAFFEREKEHRSGLRDCPADHVSVSDCAENNVVAFHGAAKKVLPPGSGSYKYPSFSDKKNTGERDDVARSEDKAH